MGNGVKFDLLTNRYLNRTSTCVRDFYDVWNLHAGLARNVLAILTRNSLAFVALLIVANLVHLSIAALNGVANSARNGAAPRAVADLVHLSGALIVGVTDIPRNVLANWIVTKVTLLFKASIALAIVLGVALCFGALNFISIASVRHLISSIDGFKLFLIKTDYLVCLVEDKGFGKCRCGKSKKQRDK